MKSYAQQGAEAERALLPDIDPQDIEIRSEFKANFRGLNRQPILGFNPQPSLYQIDSSRTPFIESQAERMANLPVVELSSPDPPQMKYFTYPAKGQLYSELEYGSYITPSVEVFGNRQLTENSMLSARIDYRSSDGHLIDDYGAFRDFGVNFGYQLDMTDTGQLKLDIGGENNFNNLYPPQIPGTFDPRNNFGGLHAIATYSSWQNDYQGWEWGAKYDFFEVESRVAGFTATTREHSALSQFSYQWTGNRLHELFKVNAQVQYGRLEHTRPVTTDSWYRLDGSVGYDRLFDYKTNLSAELGVQFAEEIDGGNLLYPRARFKVKHWLSEDFALQAMVESKLSNEILKSRYDDNPFIFAVTPVLHHSYKMGGHIKAEYELFKRTYLEVKGDYHYIQDYSFYANGQRVIQSLVGIGPVNVLERYYQIYYEDASMGTLQASLTHDLIPETIWLDIGAYYRTHKLRDGSSVPIPFMADYGMQSTIYLKPIPSLIIRFWGDYTGPRTDADNTRELDKYFLVGSRFEFQVSDHFGFYIKGLNILDQQYEVWEGYQARPRQLFGGVTISF